MATVREVTAESEMARCFAVLEELRPHLRDVEDLLRQVRRMREEGAHFAALEHGGEVATVACFRMQHMLVSGRTLYVDDLVTAKRFRSQGHGRTMLAWLRDYGREQGCETFSLDSGTFRQAAHAFYFREGLRITSFHFQTKL